MSQLPHVIVIMADQLRHDFLSPEFTPNISALMAESAVFPRMYTASPLGEDDYQFFRKAYAYQATASFKPL